MGRGRGNNSQQLNSKEILFNQEVGYFKKEFNIIDPVPLDNPAVPISKHNPNFTIQKNKILRLNSNLVQVQAPKHFIDTLDEIKAEFPAYYYVCNSCQAMQYFDEKEDRDSFLLRESECVITSCPKDKGKRFSFDFYDPEELENELSFQSQAYKTVKKLIKNEGKQMDSLNFLVSLKDCYVYNNNSIQAARLNQVSDKVDDKSTANKNRINYYDHTNFVDKEIVCDLSDTSFDNNLLSYIPGITFMTKGVRYTLPLYEIEFVAN